MHLNENTHGTPALLKKARGWTTSKNVLHPRASYEKNKKVIKQSSIETERTSSRRKKGEPRREIRDHWSTKYSDLSSIERKFLQLPELLGTRGGRTDGLHGLQLPWLVHSRITTRGRWGAGYFSDNQPTFKESVLYLFCYPKCAIY